MKILSINNNQKLAKRIAKKLNKEFSKIEIKSFPDGEIYLRIKTDVKDRIVVLIESFYPDPNKTLFDLLFAGKTLKDLKAKKVILVAPYLGFMRQDKRFKEGEAINARIFSEFLGCAFDKIVTIDPHLHRIRDLKEIFNITVKRFTTNDLIAEFIKKKFKKETIIIGPDWESYQWAELIARKVKFKFSILEKSRHTPKNVDVKFTNPIDIKGKDVVIIDDIISTGNTIVKAAKKVRQLGARRISVIGIHGIFAFGTEELLKNVDFLYTTNCIENRYAKIDVSELIIKELNKHLPKQK